MIPLIDKDAVRLITQHITPEETEYVAGIKNVIEEVNSNENIDNDDCDDVIFLTKIMAFADKFKNLHWAAKNMSYHKAIDEFCDYLEEYKDAIAENIMSIIGQFDGNKITRLTLPIGDNPLEIINELKICLNNWFQLHEDDIEYEGCRNATSGFLENVHKYIYLFRLCKIQEVNNN